MALSPLVPPGRPIIGDIGSKSYNLCRYIDHFLQPLASHQTSYMKDSFHFVEILNQFQHIPPHTLLVTMDVNSMYTNFDNADGLDCLRQIFNIYPDLLRPDNLLLELICICLLHNDFLFDGLFWLQTSGTAMG